MAYSYALTLGQKESLDFCASPSQLTPGDFGGVRLWLCLTGHQILMTVSLTPEMLPEADVVLGGRDAERLRLTYQPSPPSPRELPTPPEPMDTTEETITSILAEDPLATQRLNEFAEDLMREGSLCEAVERVMKPLPPPPLASPAPLVILDEDVKDVKRAPVVVPILKMENKPKRKLKKKRVRRSRKNNFIPSPYPSSYNFM